MRIALALRFVTHTTVFMERLCDIGDNNCCYCELRRPCQEGRSSQACQTLYIGPRKFREHYFEQSLNFESHETDFISWTFDYNSMAHSSPDPRSGQSSQKTHVMDQESSIAGPQLECQPHDDAISPMHSMAIDGRPSPLPELESVQDFSRVQHGIYWPIP